MKSPKIAPAAVHATLARHMLADGYDMVLDLGRSRGRRMHDARTGRDYLDLFSFFATLPIGFNHPKLKDADFLAKLDALQKTINIGTMIGQGFHHDRRHLAHAGHWREHGNLHIAECDHASPAASGASWGAALIRRW